MTMATDAYTRSADAGQNLTSNLSDPRRWPPVAEPAPGPDGRVVLAALTGGAFLAAGGAAAATHPDRPA